MWIPSPTACLPSCGNSRCRTRRVIVGTGLPPEYSRLADRLSEFGWETVPAINSQEARQLAYQTRAAYVLLSANPPSDESGPLVCYKLMQAVPKVKVVVVGPDQPAWEQRSRFAGANGYLPETMNLDELAQELLKV